MSMAKKCDICGKLYENYNFRCNKEKVNGFRFLNIIGESHYYEHEIVDCCPECIDAIKKAIEVRKN